MCLLICFNFPEGPLQKTPEEAKGRGQEVKAGTSLDVSKDLFAAAAVSFGVPSTGAENWSWAYSYLLSTQKPSRATRSSGRIW